MSQFQLGLSRDVWIMKDCAAGREGSCPGPPSSLHESTLSSVVFEAAELRESVVEDVIRGKPDALRGAREKQLISVAIIPPPFPCIPSILFSWPYGRHWRA